MKSINVIKVGGAVVEDEALLNDLLERFTALQGSRILVHGGGRSATRLSARLGIESRMVNGRRITDAETLRIVTMVYGGLINKNLVCRLQARGINALGLTGADMNLILSHRRPPKEVVLPDGVHEMVDYGYVGDVDRVDGHGLSNFLELGIVPVVAPLTHDGQGSLLNTNADTMASEVACALAVEGYDVTLTYCFEKSGVLRDAEDESSIIPEINETQFKMLIDDGIVSGGMIPKLENAFQALHRGVKNVFITRSDSLSDDCGTRLYIQHKDL